MEFVLNVDFELKQYSVENYKLMLLLIKLNLIVMLKEQIN